MASLADAIKEAASGLSQPGRETGGLTEEAQRLLTAKQTGRAVRSTGPARAAESERLAGVTAAGERAQVTQDALSRLSSLRQASEQIGKEAEQTRATQDFQLETLRENNQNRTQALLQDVSQKEGQMDAQERGARLEQAAFTLRLGNQKYLDELMQAGRMRRLDNHNAFQLELQQQIMSDQTSLLQDQLAFQEMMTMEDAEFSKLLANIDINAALQIAQDASSSANQAAIWSGVGGLASAGARYVYDSEKKG